MGGKRLPGRRQGGEGALWLPVRRVEDGARTPDFQIHSLTTTAHNQPPDKDLSPDAPSACRPACRTAPEDPDLARLIGAWPALPDPIRRAVLTLVDAARV
jgi:hypothetical protein